MSCTGSSHWGFKSFDGPQLNSCQQCLIELASHWSSVLFYSFSLNSTHRHLLWMCELLWEHHYCLGGTKKRCLLYNFTEPSRRCNGDNHKWGETCPMSQPFVLQEASDQGGCKWTDRQRTLRSFVAGLLVAMAGVPDYFQIMRFMFSEFGWREVLVFVRVGASDVVVEVFWSCNSKMFNSCICNFLIRWLGRLCGPPPSPLIVALFLQCLMEQQCLNL